MLKAKSVALARLCPGEGRLPGDALDGPVSPACVGVGCFMRMGLNACHEFDVVEKLCVEVLSLLFTDVVCVE